ncbi:MAG TPA: dihydrodipicolinate synthase family protein [Bryobacteraceae bacterium]|nr:dihydrodipicolinate synthase family protein [Bryobacteraceae bacterium]
MRRATDALRGRLLEGLAIPAHPLALDAARRLSERHQRALTRYYLAAGAGGVAVGVHTTQFAIRNPAVGLFRPVLQLAMDELLSSDAVKVAGICGQTRQAVQEAELAAEIGYDCGLLSLGAMANASVPELIAHARAVAEVLPVFGFYLQPSVGGRILPLEFWREFASIDNVIAIKVAPFNRYQTLDVLRAVAESGRADEVALYTGNDDNIVLDLLTTTDVNGRSIHFAGGLLGHWAVWTKRAVELLAQLKEMRQHGSPPEILTLAQQVTDSNAALFDPSHQFRGCIAGIHEVLRRQGLIPGLWCLDPDEGLSEGQIDEINRVYREYPHLTDDDFVRENLDGWLKF